MEEKAGGNWEDIAQKSLSAEASSYSRSEKLRDKDGISPREKKNGQRKHHAKGEGRLKPTSHNTRRNTGILISSWDKGKGQNRQRVNNYN